MRVLKSNDILKELHRIDERFEEFSKANNDVLKYLQDFYEHLNKALGAFEELELSQNLKESLTENELKSFIEALSIDVGKLEKALDSKKKIYQKDKEKFKRIILKIKDTYTFFVAEYEECESVVNKKIKQYVWLMKEAVFSLDSNIKGYNQKYNENLQEIF